MCNVARHKGKENEFQNLRFHLKNYYTVVCKFGNDAILGVGPFNKDVARVDLDGARGVCDMLEKARMLMEYNANRIIWPW